MDKRRCTLSEVGPARAFKYYIEYIAATEKLCQSLEEIGDPDSIARAQGIRNMVSGELRKGFDMKIKTNLSKEEREILRKIGEE